MLRFKKGEKFKVMQIADVQELPNISVDTMSLLTKAIETEMPDLVVLTGDQIKGYGITYSGDLKEKEEKVSQTIKNFMKPIFDANIPFIVTFGNHDDQVGITNKEQFEDVYGKMPNFVYSNVNYFEKRVDSNLEIKASDSDKTVLNFTLIDSGGHYKTGYDVVKKEQIEWYKSIREKLKAENGGEYVPTLVFQHIPIFEYFDVLTKTSRFTKGAIRAFGVHKNEFYTIGDKCRKGGILLEPPSIPYENTGEFEALKEKGDVFAMYVGHDHKNNFVGTHEGIDLGFTQSAGFNEYGNGTKRGVRIFEFNEENPRNYETRTVTFETLCGNKLDKPVKDFIYRHFPASVDAAILLGRNVALTLGAIGVTAWALSNLF